MQKQKKSKGHVCWGDCCCKKFTWHSVSRIFLAIAVFLLIFVACLAAGIGREYHEGKNFNRKYTGQGEFFKGGCVGQGLIAKSWARDENEKITVLFGEITKVEGNQITILDNGAKEQLILSLTDTHIVSGTTEVGLSYLKAGQGAIFTVVSNKDKQLEAKLIKLQ